MYSSADYFLQQADQGLCSPQCPCKFNNSTALDKFKQFYPQIEKTWSINSNGVTNFTNCSSQVQQNAYDTAQAKNKNQFANANSSFEIASFYSAWAAIENTFNCSGFCKTNYTNSNNTNITMIKYLFTDINRYYINLF